MLLLFSCKKESMPPDLTDPKIHIVLFNGERDEVINAIVNNSINAIYPQSTTKPYIVV